MRTVLALYLIALIGCDGETYSEFKAEREAKQEADRILANRNARLIYGPRGWWGWSYVGESDVQYSSGDSMMVLRKVKSDEHVVMAYLDDEGFSATSFWKAPCTPDTVIETSVVDEYGPIELECDYFHHARGAYATWLTVEVIWPDREKPARWRDDFDGFVVDENFRDWDWSKARQWATLKRASQAEE